MSNLLDQAIIDAEALKEVAMKNAEITILEKFSDQIKEAVEQILDEQPEDVEALEVGEEEVVDDEAEDVLAQLSPASAEGVEMCPCPDVEDTEEITIDLASLEQELGGEEPTDITAEPGAEMLGAEEEEEEIPGGELALESLEVDEDDLASIMLEYTELSTELTLEEELLDELTQMLEEDDTLGTGISSKDIEAEDEGFEAGAEKEAAGPSLSSGDDETKSLAATSNPLGESVDIDENDLNEIVEEALTVDIDPLATEKSGWMNTPQGTFQLAEEELLAMLQDSERREKHDAMVKATKELQESHNKLQSNVKKLKADKKELLSIADKLKNKLNETNLTNAKLLYTNKVLMNNSLNERQKNKIARALSNSENVEEAKVIYETLQSATGSTIKEKKPESLSEALNKATSTVILSHRKRERETAIQEDLSVDRWKILAGLKQTKTI